MINQNDESTCPLCQQPNRCEVKKNSTCWCMSAEVIVPQALLDKIPSQLKCQSCICNACIADYHQQKAPVVNTQ